MAQDIRYPTHTKTVKGRTVVTFPDVRGVHGSGETQQEALRAATDALTQALVEMLAADKPLPKASRVAGATYVVPGAKVQAAVLFRRWRGNLTMAELGRRLSTSAWSRVRDLERAENVTLDRADRAARALGFRLVLSYEPEPAE